MSSASGGSAGDSEDSTGADSTDTGYGAACDLGLLERLVTTHAVWFLPGIQRAGAFHLLQGKEEGVGVMITLSNLKGLKDKY